jgi:signal transduction histidine kinase
MTVRVKLALLYGIMFLAGAVALVALSYQLVARNLPTQTVVAASGSDVVLRANKLLKTPGTSESDRAILAQIVTLPPDKALALANGSAAKLSPEVERSLLSSLPTEVRSAALHQLLVQSSIALGVLAVASFVVGWFVAGRVLRPLTRITDTARQLSASNLDERIDLRGPDDELTRLANTFDAMLDRLAGAFEGQRRFVANASHELRTPLTIMAAELDVTLARPDATIADLRRMGGTVRSAVGRSDRLITSLLALARVEQGLEVAEPADLAAVAAEVIERRSGELSDADLVLEATLDRAVVVGDPGLLDRLVDNLLDNAIRYNVANGWVHIRTKTAMDGKAFLEVASSGAVVAADAVEGLFEPFRRLDARTGSQRGVGLGLSIVKAIAGAHGGSASAEAVDAGGLRVTVLLPAAHAPVATPAPSEANAVH